MLDLIREHLSRVYLLPNSASQMAEEPWNTEAQLSCLQLLANYLTQISIR